MTEKITGSTTPAGTLTRRIEWPKPSLRARILWWACFTVVLCIALTVDTFLWKWNTFAGGFALGIITSICRDVLEN